MRKLAQITFLGVVMIATVAHAGADLSSISSSTVYGTMYDWRLHQLPKYVDNEVVFRQQLFLLQHTPRKHSQKGLSEEQIEKILAMIREARYNEAKSIIRSVASSSTDVPYGATVFSGSMVIK